MNRALEIAIINTLRYHNLFDYPLNKLEIYQFLISNLEFRVKDSELKIKISNYLDKLEKKGIVLKEDSLYCLKGREKIIGLRKQREKYSQEKIGIAKNIVQIIKVIPWIKFVGITGALAMDNARVDDDIDLLVITQDNRLWLTRLVIILILELIGKRRRPNNSNKQKAIRNKTKDKICLNMWLDESALSLLEDRQNLFTAHEVIQMKPIWDKDRTYIKFITANLWVKDYLPNSIDITTKNIKYPNIPMSQYYNIVNKFEKIAFQFQHKYMKSKMTNEEVNPHFAFFHPQNRAREILNKFRKG